MRPIFLVTAILTLILVLIAPHGFTSENNGPDEPHDPYSEENLSILNGQLVEVGEKNKYTLDYNKWSVWTNPFGYFLGSYNVGASYALSQHFKVNLEPEFIYTYFVPDPIYGGGATVSGTFFFKKMYSGFYVEPGARFLALTQKNVGNDTLIGAAQLIGGWGWVWDSGFTVNVGVGMAYYFGNSDFEDTGAFEGPGLAGNLQIGYSF